MYEFEKINLSQLQFFTSQKWSSDIYLQQFVLRMKTCEVFRTVPNTYKFSKIVLIMIIIQGSFIKI